MPEKVRSFIALHKKEVVFCAVIFATASLSFGLGYLANREFNHAPIIIEKCADTLYTGYPDASGR